MSMSEPVKNWRKGESERERDEKESENANLDKSAALNGVDDGKIVVREEKNRRQFEVSGATDDYS